MKTASTRLDYSTPLDRVLALLPDARKNGSGWTARCPGHDDKHASLSVGEGDDGRVLLKCFGGCTTEAVVSALRLEMRDLFPRRETHPPSPSPFRLEHSNGAPGGVTLAQYAEVKRLPVPFLQGVGCADAKYDGRPAVRMAYRATDGTVLAVRFRVRLEKGEQDDRFKWRSGDKVALYGLWRLADARARGYAVVVEGESDCQTLWQHGEPALGVPGATNWRESWAEYLAGVPKVYVWIEPDKGGEAVLAWLSKSNVRMSACLLYSNGLGAKDPSAMYLADPATFRERWAAAVAAAVPWAEIDRQRREQAASGAYELARDLLHDPGLLGRVRAAIVARGFAGDPQPSVLAYLALTSRLLERPLNLAVLGPSAAGKNRAVDGALELCPPSAYYVEGAGSARALIYNAESFEHRTVVVSEADSIPEDGPAASAIRSLAQDNQMLYDIVEKDEQSGQWQTRHIVKPGPTGLITTSIRSLGEQMATRVLEVPMPDDPEQTKAVMRAHARAVNGNAGPIVDLEPFMALQEYLAASDAAGVVVPFADVLADLVPHGAVRMRRDFRQLLTCVQAVALLYQCQRERMTDDRVVATVADYAAARDLLAPIFDVVISEGATPAIRATVAALKPDEEVTSTELGRRLGIAKSTVSWRVNRAIDAGWLVNREQRKNHPAKLALGTPIPDTQTALPAAERVAEVFECSNANRHGEKGGVSPDDRCHVCGGEVHRFNAEGRGFCQAHAGGAE